MWFLYSVCFIYFACQKLFQLKNLGNGELYTYKICIFTLYFKNFLQNLFSIIHYCFGSVWMWLSGFGAFLYFFTVQNCKYWIRGSVLLFWIHVNKTVFHTVKRELFKIYFYASNFNSLPDYLEGPNYIKYSNLLPCSRGSLLPFLFLVIWWGKNK